MEKLHFEFEGSRKLKTCPSHSLVGVVASGNLEVMIEPTALDGRMHIDVITAARGFSEIWGAVLHDFSKRHPLADVHISINDTGATPAVVSLRLDQAVEAFEGDIS